MRHIERLFQTVEADKDIQNIMRKRLHYYDTKIFIRDAFEYIESIRNKSMFCVIKNVSPNGMSRKISFNSVKKYKKDYFFRQYIYFFTCLGFTRSRSNDSLFVIYGAGMDMIFATNYDIIRKLHRLGFITDKDRELLCQMTPSTF